MHTAYKVSKAYVCCLHQLTRLLRSVYICIPFLAIRSPHLASSILFQSSGLTNGIIKEMDIPEELPRERERKQQGGEDYENINNDQESVDEEADVSMMSVSCLR